MKRFLFNAKRKFVAMISMAAVIVFMTVSTALAASPTPAPVNLTEISTAVTNQLSVEQIVSIIAAVIAGSMAFVVLWFGARKLTKALVHAFKTGKIHF
jgi:hypothetical protein